MLKIYQRYPTLADCIILTLFFTGFYALWIGSYALFTPDEGRYSEVAREMVAAQDYITPRLNGVGFFDKPILYYWLQASAIQLWGLKESALRFWPMMIGVFGCLITYLATLKFYDRRTAVLASLILGLNPFYYSAAHYANLDLEVAVFISSALFFFLMSTHSVNNSSRRNLLILAYVSTALAILTKGLIGILFPIMIIGAWILILNKWQLLLKMYLPFGFLIVTAIVLPWFVWVQHINPQFNHFFFYIQHYERFFGDSNFNNQTPFWFYIPLIFAGLMPWSLFLPQAFYSQYHAIKDNIKAKNVVVFLFLWIILILLFFSIPKSKTIGYILPILPPIAIFIASYFSKYWQTCDKSILYGRNIFIVTCLLLTILCLTAQYVSFVPVPFKLMPYLFITALLLFCVSYLIYYCRQTSQIFKWLTFTSISFLMILINSASILNYKSIKPTANIINQLIEPTDEVVTYHRYYQDLPLYLQKRITIVSDWQQEKIKYEDNWRRELWYNMAFQDTSDWLIQEKTFWKRWQDGHKVFVIMQQNAYRHFLKNMALHAPDANAFPLGDDVLLKTHNKVILLSNQKNRNPPK